jgi:uncharacterized membrane protein YfcA
MELEELKSIWKSNDTAFQLKDEAEIASMLKGKSKSIVDKLKRSVWFDLIFTLVTGVVLIVYAFTLPNGGLKLISISFLLICVGYSFFYIKKITMLNRFDPASENLRAVLERLVDNLSSYLKFYKLSYTILYPVYFCIGIVFGALDRGMDAFLHSLTRPLTIVYLLAASGFFFFCSTWLANWYLKKLYGNHLDKLRGLLNDLSHSA